MKLTHFAAFDPNNDVIWGYGSTELDAIVDAIRWLNESDDEDKADINDLQIIPASEELATGECGGERGEFSLLPHNGSVAAVTHEEFRTAQAA